MGRSQVARNQRRGRPGETGRGRGGATTTSTTTSSQSKPKHQVTGDNSFRYQDKSPNNLGNNQEEEEWDGMIMGGSGNYGPSHDFVQIASLQSPVEELFDQEEERNHHPLSASIDAMQLAKCLNKLDRSIWMRMSDRITDIYDDQLGKRSGEVKKMTLSEMNACPTPTSVVDSVAGAVDTLQVTDDIERVDTIQKEENDKAGSDDGEDLEDWLDGMIE
jgi:hypothetical protein